MIFLVKEEELCINNAITSLYFYADWMPMHKKIMIMIDKVEQKYTNNKFLAINVDYFKSLCNRFNVESIPTIVIFKDGHEIKRINGVVMTSAFKSVFADICNSSDPLNME